MSVEECGGTVLKVVPHHDGSELYVSSALPRIGEMVTLRVRIPHSYFFENALIRFYQDGEPRSKVLKKIREDKYESWWQVRIELTNRITRYRFLFSGPEQYDWLTGGGFFNHDVHSNSDFRIVANDSRPSWLSESVFYQIFPDRFAKTSEKKLPEWAVPRDWNLPPRFNSKYTGIEVYGGDLKGVRENLNHIQELGANAIYFTPFFPAQSNHRYDASDFDRVDPLLGGNKEWFKLIKALRARKMRVIGDITTNHVGSGHKWFLKAIRAKNSTERSFFFWTKKFAWGYVGWWDLPSLPKLNFDSVQLRKRLYGAKNSIVKRWLAPQYGLSGWRIDVSNMTGVYGEQDLHDEVMRGIRTAMDEVHEDAWLVAENADFVSKDLEGLGWHGTMNYQGFFRPFAAWMSNSQHLVGGFQGLPIKSPRISGKQMVSTITNFNGSIPWSSLVSSMLLIDSHDTPRFRTIVDGDVHKHLAGMVFLLTYPGVPSIFMGDEIGLVGQTGEDSRRTINWDDRTEWDHEFFSQIKHIVRLRKNSSALKRGGLRWIAVEDDYIAYIRESKVESLLVLISRSGCSVAVDLSAYGYRVNKTLVGPEQMGTKISMKSASAMCGIWSLSPQITD